MKFSLDRDRAIEVAKQMNIDLSFNSDIPGVFISGDEGVKRIELEDLFPELDDLKS